jgi:hypothetical protein
MTTTIEIRITFVDEFNTPVGKDVVEQIRSDFADIGIVAKVELIKEETA